jgi:hypothetical protein
MKLRGRYKRKKKKKRCGDKSKSKKVWKEMRKLRRKKER